MGHYDNDLLAINQWLTAHRDSPHTYRSYYRQAHRLMMWAINVAQKPLSSLNAADLTSFKDFLSNPPERYRNSKNNTVAPQHPQKLFSKDGMSAVSVQQALTIVANLFAFLVKIEYLQEAPFPSISTFFNPSKGKKCTRFFSAEQLDFLFKFIEMLPRNTLRERKTYERTYWTFRFLVETGLSEFEAANAKVGDLELINSNWWIKVRSREKLETKKHNLVPISNELMIDFARYRTFYGRPTIPGVNETTPIIMKVSGSGEEHLTPTALYRFTKEILRKAGAFAALQGDAGTANVLSAASPSWLRHTSAVEMIRNGVPLQYVMRNLRHRNIESTMKYNPDTCYGLGSN